MPNGSDLLKRLSDLGIKVIRNGDRLGLIPKNRVTPKIREQVRANKPALLAALPDQEAYRILRGIVGNLGLQIRFLEEEGRFSVPIGEARFESRDSEVSSACEIGFWLSRSTSYLQDHKDALIDSGEIYLVPTPRKRTKGASR